MLAASFFSLIIPALDHMKSGGVSPWGRASVAALSVALGGGMIIFLARLFPEPEKPLPPGEMDHHSLWLFVLAITLHNLPEGLAVGVSFANGAYAEGSATAFGIGIQNIPEGFAVGCALALRYSPLVAFGGALVSGLVEPVAGAAGALLVAQFQPLLPWALCLAAGGMISVIIGQIAPMLGQGRAGGAAQWSFIAGLCLMMLLDIALS
jgi:ZIP family zinc transporter